MKAIHMPRQGWYWCKRDHGGRLVVQGPYRNQEECEEHQRAKILRWGRGTRPSQFSKQMQRYLKDRL